MTELRTFAELKAYLEAKRDKALEVSARLIESKGGTEEEVEDAVSWLRERWDAEMGEVVATGTVH